MHLKLQKYTSSKHIAIFGVLCLFIVLLQAQIRPKQLRQEVLQSLNPTAKSTKTKGKKPPTKPTKALVIPNSLAPIVNPLSNRNATIIYLENTETMSMNGEINPDMQILKGNVRFRHDNALLYCDSAYFYQKANSLDAFSNVRIVQGDTLFVFGDFLYYDGNMKLARLRQNVKLVDKKTTLTTDSLNYSRLDNLAYYYTGGKIVDPENTLTSIWGQYSTTSNDALFRNTVRLTNKNFKMEADTMQYNTKSTIANLIGPTHIIYQDETDIYSKKGWYNTTTELMQLLNRSFIKHKDGKTIVGDTVYYDKIKKYGEAFNKVILNDTVRKTTLTGDYIYYNENTEIGIATDSALLCDWSSKDTLWVHADTLRTFKDSIYDVARGYFNVRLYRNDVQGLCDSLVYTSRDSVMNMYGEPVLWTENNQLSGEKIQAFIKEEKVERIEIQTDAMAVQKEDSLYFNQLSGKEIIAYVDSGELRRVNVNGNAETIYYPRDDKDSTLIGLNKTESSFVVMYLKDKKADRIVLTTASSGIMYPLDQLKGGDLYLKNYFWIENQRPKNKFDLFTFFPKTPREKIGTSSLMDTGSSDSESKNPADGKKSSAKSSSGNLPAPTTGTRSAKQAQSVSR